jgi:hypothetical protein
MDAPSWGPQFESENGCSSSQVGSTGNLTKDSSQDWGKLEKEIPRLEVSLRYQRTYFAASR